MEQKINVAQLLKDCPKGMELYSPIFGTVYFEGVRDTGRAIMIDLTTSCNTSVQFYSNGKFNTYYSESEVTLFPSKSQRDWSKFQRPFKDGDIITCTNSACSFVAIFKSKNTDTTFNRYALLILNDEHDFKSNIDISDFIQPRFATEEEKEKLFKAIKDNGYRWNSETKTLDPLVKDKFDINTLVPYESKVLVRDSQSDKWQPAIWGFYNDDGTDYPYEVVGCNIFTYCIPYEGNEHLLGTWDDCDDYYITWGNIKR